MRFWAVQQLDQTRTIRRFARNRNEATRDAQKGAKQLAADAKVAAANAVKGVNAVAQGVKDGVKSGKAGDPGDKVDINSASTATSSRCCQESASARPTTLCRDGPIGMRTRWCTRGLLTQEQYDRIADKITAR